MFGIAFELLYLTSDFVDVSKQAAGRFAVEASGWNERIVTFFTLWPGARIEFGPIVPAFFGWKGGEVNAGRSGIESFAHWFVLGESLLSGSRNVYQQTSPCFMFLPNLVRTATLRLLRAVLAV